VSDDPDVTANEDYKPMFTIQTASGKRFKVIVVEDF
jgi:hypothetical protein